MNADTQYTVQKEDSANQLLIFQLFSLPIWHDMFWLALRTHRRISPARRTAKSHQRKGIYPARSCFQEQPTGSEQLLLKKKTLLFKCFHIFCLWKGCFHIFDLDKELNGNTYKFKTITCGVNRFELALLKEQL